MTTATCIFCGTLKFGAFVPCQECDRIPTERADVVRSLALTDHHFTHEQLAEFGAEIQSGHELKIDPKLHARLSEEIDDHMLQTLARMSDPARREFFRKRERNVILFVMAMILTSIGWMIYRFAVSQRSHANKPADGSVLKSTHFAPTR